MRKIFQKIPKLILILLAFFLLLIALVFLAVALNLPIWESQELVEKPAEEIQSLFKTPTPIPSLIPSLTHHFTPSPTPLPASCKFVPILQYHHLLSSADAEKLGAQNLNVPPEIFEKQILYMIKKGYQTIFLDELMDGLKGNRKLPAKPIVITFDDGYAELYHVLFPLMKAKNFKATVFVIANFLDSSDYLTWRQLKEMASNNLLEIGNHTLSHSLLTDAYGEGFIRNQIISAQKIINERTGRPIKVFSHTLENPNEMTLKVLSQEKYSAAVLSGGAGPACATHPYEIPRIRIGAAPLSVFGL